VGAIATSELAAVLQGAGLARIVAG
jgi:hypothetical protein